MGFLSKSPAVFDVWNQLKAAETKDSDGLLSIQSSNLLSGAMGPVRRSGRDGSGWWFDIYKTMGKP